MTITREQAIKGITRNLREFGYGSLTEDEVARQVAIIYGEAEGEESIIGGFARPMLVEAGLLPDPYETEAHSADDSQTALCARSAPVAGRGPSTQDQHPDVGKGRNEMNLDDITLEDFRAYEEVRASGVTNMLSPDVQALAGISREVHFAIMTHYADLCDKWPAVRAIPIAGKRVEK